MKNQELVKRATVGLIGDKVKEISLVRLYGRVQDQASKYGVNAPAWPMFVDAVRDLDYDIEGTNPDDAMVVFYY